jgi:hypothetical protein
MNALTLFRLVEPPADPQVAVGKLVSITPMRPVPDTSAAVKVGCETPGPSTA